MFCNVNHNNYSLFPAGEDDDGGSGGVLTQQPHLAELSHVTASNVQQVCFAGGPLPGHQRPAGTQEAPSGGRADV